MGALKEAARARASQPKPPSADEIQESHPTLDSPAAATRMPYNPPPPEKRFAFLKRFATVPGLRAKGAAQSQGM